MMERFRIWLAYRIAPPLLRTVMHVGMDVELERVNRIMERWEYGS